MAKTAAIRHTQSVLGFVAMSREGLDVSKPAVRFPFGFRIVCEGRESVAIDLQVSGEVVDSLFAARRTGVLAGVLECRGRHRVPQGLTPA